jgi:hypothetical protein
VLDSGREADRKKRCCPNEQSFERGTGRDVPGSGERKQTEQMTNNRLNGLVLVVCAQVLSLGAASGQKAPDVLGNFLKLDTMTKGEIVVVIPPLEISKYVAMVEESATKHPEWFRKYSETAKPGLPLPYHENLGMSKEDYAKYLALWDKREMQAVPNGEVAIRLEHRKEGEWMVRVSGEGSPISLLRYMEKTDKTRSPNGMMDRLEDINAEERSILGAWTGHEWKFQEDSVLGKIKENFAIGKLANNKTGLLIYRLQEVSSTGRLLYDKSLVIRFALPPKKS